MDVKTLEDIGLPKVQAEAYIALVENGACTAPAVAELIGESRSNAYKVLDKLCDLKLASKDTSGTKIHYTPSSPATLEQILQNKAEQISLQERKFNASLPSMLSYYSEHSEQPIIRFFQGKDGLKRVFGDMLKTGKNIYLLRSPGDDKFYDKSFFEEFSKKRAKLGINTYAITPDLPAVNHDPNIDKLNKFIRTWIPAEAYTANVEWDVYGNKVALISYGDEAIATIIESPQIAESFRQVFRLLTSNTTLKSRNSE